MSVAEYRDRIAGLHLEIQDKHREAARSIRDLDGYIGWLAQEVRAGRPTSGLVEAAQEHLSDIETHARQLFDAVELATEVMEEVTSEIETRVESFESTHQSIQTLKQRIQHAKAAGDTQAISALAQEHEQLELELESYEQHVNQYKEFFRNSEKLTDCLVDVRAALAARQWDQDLQKIEKLVSPPVLAAFLLAAVCKPTLRDGVLGDAEEAFSKNLDEHGCYWAMTLYWVDTFRSIGPLIGRFVVRAVWAYLFFSK